LLLLTRSLSCCEQLVLLLSLNSLLCWTSTASSCSILPGTALLGSLSCTLPSVIASIFYTSPLIFWMPWIYANNVECVVFTWQVFLSAISMNSMTKEAWFLLCCLLTYYGFSSCSSEYLLFSSTVPSHLFKGHCVCALYTAIVILHKSSSKRTYLYPKLSEMSSNSPQCIVYCLVHPRGPNHPFTQSSHVTIAIATHVTCTPCPDWTVNWCIFRDNEK
jgi:hypothetical protein